ncbi:uncharacterized protein LOC100375121 [Saccoglossus kowalevskii]|uniref:Uncharacterized protein LOC100375121 n=1 Tax=Saccoglossus kowalevskii TaxID=10224 RepID=A0ABM0GM21_SACKO|nr:PREDICTED: uncharacterized protein LOC100375121 [Saccoglossus kowalevskii]
MSRKKLTSVAAESRTERNEEWTLNFIDIVTNYDVEQLHWFDESSVIKTTGNRVYGHAEKGKAAVEIQRHATNANYTVNLLVSSPGIDNVDIIDGPSNGLEMVNFFEEAVRTVDAFGNPVLSQGDCVILDNCGFHHGRQVEPVLRELLRGQGVELLFQPPYSPQFNVCELCFRYLKIYLKDNEEYTYNFTELAIADALTRIGPGVCRRFAFNCAYI